MPPVSESPLQNTLTPSQQLAVVYLDRAVFVLLELLALATAITPKAAVFGAPVVVVWVMKVVVRRSVPRLPLAAPMLALLISTALASFFAYDRIASWTRMRMFGALLLAVIIGETCATLPRLKLLTYTLFFSTLIAVGWAVCQYKVGMGPQFRGVTPALANAGIAPGDIVHRVNGKVVFTRQAWQEAIESIPPSEPIRLQLIHPQDDARSYVTVPAGEIRHAGSDRAEAMAIGRPVRASGFFQQYISFAELLALVAILAWGLTITVPGRIRWSFAVIFVVIGACLLATKTRSAIAVVLLACLLTLWQAGGWKVRTTALAASVGLLLLTSLWIRHSRGLDWVALKDPGTQYRLMIWQDGLRLIAQHPLVGVGFDNVVRHPDHWRLNAYRLFPLKSHFHSTPIEYAVDGGLLTLGAWLWLLGAYCALLLRVLRKARDCPFVRGLALGILGGLIAFFAMSIVQYIGGDSDVMTVFWFIMGLAIALHQILAKRAPANVAAVTDL